jgi:hypothetical protein
MGSNVRFGSLADMCSAKGHVGFTPESGHLAGRAGGLDLLVKQTLQSQFDNPAKTFLEIQIDLTGPERIEPPTFDLGKPPTRSAILKQAENPYFLLAFKSSSAAEIPRFALRVKAVGCGFHSETSFSALSSSGLVRIPAISFTCFLGGTFESLKYAYAKAKSFGAPFP